MKRIIFGGIFIAIIGAALAIIAPQTAQAAAEWGETPVHVLRKTVVQVDSFGDGVCSGYELPITINLIGDYSKACVFGKSDGIRIARFINNGTYQYGIAFPNQQIFYEARGLCTGGRCVYSPETDTVLKHLSIASNYGIAAYRDVSKLLVHKIDPSTRSTYYQFQPPAQPDFILKSADYIFRAEAVGISSNGKWAIVELRSYGFVRIDMQTFDARRVIAPGAHYDLGNDPTYELAISDDGRYVLTTGFRASTRLVRVDSTCGDYLVSGSGGYFAQHIRPCTSIPFDMYQYSPLLYKAFAPKFNSHGDRIMIAVQNTNGTYERVVLAPDQVAGNEGYIALGDSFTSGEGEVNDSYYRAGSNDAIARCHVSVRSYPYSLANRWGISGQSVACSGARTVDVIGRQPYYAQNDSLKTVNDADRLNITTQALTSFRSGIRLQSDFVSHYQPQVVTIGIGGNDAGLMGKLTACLNVTTCEWATDVHKRYASAKEIAEVYPKIRQTIRALQAQSPSSTYIVVGYPQIISSTSNARCDIITGALLNQDERIFINAAITYLNRVIKAAALAEKVQFADIETSLMGNELCGAVDSKAMNGVRFGDDIAPINFLSNFKAFGAESFHPTALGHARIAESIFAQFSDLLTIERCTSCHLNASVPTPSNYWGATTTEYRKQFEMQTMATGAVDNRGTLAIVTDTFTFMPNTEVTAVMYSEPVELHKGEASDEGKYESVVELPEQVTPGYHVLHLYGTSPAGEPIDVYRTIAVEALTASHPGDEEGEPTPAPGYPPTAPTVSEPQGRDTVSTFTAANDNSHNVPWWTILKGTVGTGFSTTVHTPAYSQDTKKQSEVLGVTNQTRDNDHLLLKTTASSGGASWSSWLAVGVGILALASIIWVFMNKYRRRVSHESNR